MEKMKLKSVKRKIKKYKNNKRKLKINLDFNKESLTKLHNLQSLQTIKLSANICYSLKINNFYRITGSSI
jgi:hypothetical protein